MLLTFSNHNNNLNLDTSFMNLLLLLLSSLNLDDQKISKKFNVVQRNRYIKINCLRVH